jgi:phosphoribosylformimino-5-aminoimidazole carboxamide ribotide isomerase
MAGLGVRLAVHTDISRDGVLAGVNAAASANLAQKSGLQVIASGGVASLDDVREAAAYANQGVTGVITGRALYEGQLDLASAIAAVAGIEAHDVPGETWKKES